MPDGTAMPTPRYAAPERDEAAGMSETGQAAQAKTSAQRAGLWGGLAAFAAIVLLPAPEGLSREGWTVVALLVLMATWWVTEAIPIPGQRR